MALLCAVVACNSDPGSPGGERGRAYRMGFSAFPPKPDMSVALAALDLWVLRADAAILHMEVPWQKLLSGMSADQALQEDGIDIARYYRGRQMTIVFTVDVTDGLARDREAPALRAAGRSITEPEIQQLYRAYVVAVARHVQPDYLGLAAETNLIRLAAPRPVYDALVRMTADAARDVRALGREEPLFVSVQVETVWGRLGGTGRFQGIDQDLIDFPFMAALGLSSYPYLGGFAEPDQVPLDYYDRLRRGHSLPMLVVEGGWASASSPAFQSSPDKQASWVRRHALLLEEAEVLAAFQLTFTDLDLTSFPPPIPEILPLFATLGLVDAELRPKPSLAVWDSLFALPLQNRGQQRP
jgi:hypothetical protein